MMEALGAEVLSAKSLIKSYSGVRALGNGSLGIRRGEVHALVGENGAGKSTLTRIITGMTGADGGELSLFGETIQENHPRLARKLGVAAIYQQPQLFPHLSIAENIALPLEQDAHARFVDRKSTRLNSSHVEI